MRSPLDAARFDAMVREVHGRQDEIVRMVARKVGPEWAEDATSDAFAEVLGDPAKLESYATAQGRSRPTSEDLMAFVVTKAYDRARDAKKHVEGREKNGPRSFVAFDEAIGLPADTDSDFEDLDETGGSEWLDRFQELLLRLPEDLRQFARVRLVEMGGAPDSRLTMDEAREHLGLTPKGWRKRATRLKAALAVEVEGMAAGTWCAEHRSVIADLVLARTLNESDGVEALHLRHCERCNDYVLHVMAGMHDRAAAVLPPVPALAGAGLLASIAARVGDWFSSGEGATVTAGGTAASGGLLAGGTAVKACAGLAAVGCVAVATPVVIEKVDPKPAAPAARAETTARPAAAAPVATVVPAVTATPSPALIRSQSRAQSRSAQRARRAARREKRSSADAAFKSSSAASATRSASVTGSDKAFGVAPRAAPVWAPAGSSGSSGSGGGGAGGAPTSADKAFGLSTDGG